VSNLFYQNIHANKPFFLLAVDYEKAYDSINREATLMLMDLYNFPPQLLNVMFILLSQSDSFFALPKGNILTIRSRSGVKQGCPVSCYTFCLIIDLFLDATETLPCVDLSRGYVDDCSLIGSKISSLRAIFELLYRFCASTGMKINKGKSSIILFKIPTSSIPPEFKEIEVTNSVRYLGIIIGTSFSSHTV
jgi:hypothetical protein